MSDIDALKEKVFRGELLVIERKGRLYYERYRCVKGESISRGACDCQ